MFLEISQNSQENTCVAPVSESQACNFMKKETLAQVLSSEFCEISKNTFFRTLPVAASEVKGIVTIRPLSFTKLAAASVANSLFTSIKVYFSCKF